jgi:acyl carrier protein
MEVSAVIRTFIAADLLFTVDGFPYADEDSFLKEGIIDSLGVMDLVAFVGKSFGITVAPEEVTPANFDSVNRLADYIRRKQTAGAVVSTERRCEVNA